MSAGADLLDRGDDTSRLNALSDGIFSVAMTLLVLDLKLPDTTAGPLTAMMARLLPKLLSYGLTFAVVGAFWLSHHRMLRHIAGYNRVLLWLNLLFLALLTLVPFPTDLIGRFNTDAADAQLAWTVYSVNLSLLGLTLFAMWRAALADGLVTRGAPAWLGGYLGARVLITPAVFVLSIAIYPISGAAAHWSPILILPVGAVVRRVYSRRAK